VAVLRLNVGLDGLDQERTRLRAEKAELVSRLAGELSPARIEQRARTELGFVPVKAGETRFVDLGRP